jgi:L-ribulose-5-phosphate 4-epimerase
VVGTSGNASARDPETNLVVTKPSGVDFDDLTPENLVVVALDGNVVEGNLKPSVDIPSIVYVFKRRGNVHGVIHTHSPYATTFAIRGEPIPVLTTTHSALFGAPIPVSDYATIGAEEIGEQILRYVGDGTAVLVRSHGVFTIGKDVFRALRSAMYVEESAEVAHLAMLRGPIEPLADDTVAQMRDWYLERYGQKPIESGS